MKVNLNYILSVSLLMFGLGSQAQDLPNNPPNEPAAPSSSVPTEQDLTQLPPVEPTATNNQQIPNDKLEEDPTIKLPSTDPTQLNQSEVPPTATMPEVTVNNPSTEAADKPAGSEVTSASNQNPTATDQKVKKKSGFKRFFSNDKDPNKNK